MYTSIVILVVLASILMCLIVLIQESKGGGLSAAYSNNNQILGAPKTTNFVEKATWTLAGAMVVLSIVCAYVAPVAQTEESVIEKAATEQSATNPNNLPGFGASQKEAPAQQQAPAK